MQKHDISTPEIIIEELEMLSTSRLAVGDVIRCSDFERGFRTNDGKLLVAWTLDSKSHRDALVRSSRGMYADDPSRGKALFIIKQVLLKQTDGPEDVCPGEHRLGRAIVAARLSDNLSILQEQVEFELDEPMCLCIPDSKIEIIGFIKFPVVWSDLAHAPNTAE